MSLYPLGRFKTVTEGLNDWEWQVGLTTHEWKGAEDPVFPGLGSKVDRDETPVPGHQVIEGGDAFAPDSINKFGGLL
jgi:hypothetical protein